jgi:hypothetical protein
MDRFLNKTKKRKRRGKNTLMREINTPLMKARKITGYFLV